MSISSKMEWPVAVGSKITYVEVADANLSRTRKNPLFLKTNERWLIDCCWKKSHWQASFESSRCLKVGCSPMSMKNVKTFLVKSRWPLRKKPVWRLNVMSCGLSLGIRKISNGFGWPWIVIRARSSAFMSVAVTSKAPRPYGTVCHRCIANAPLAIRTFGQRTPVFFPANVTTP